MAEMKKKIIAACFPGIGRTHANNFRLFHDIEPCKMIDSTINPLYHEIEAEKILTLAYETYGFSRDNFRYLKMITFPLDEKMMSYIEAQAELKENRRNVVPYIIIAPKHGDKDKYISGLRKRGYSKCDGLEEHWDRYMDIVTKKENEGIPVMRVSKHLSDIFIYQKYLKFLSTYYEL